MIKIEAVICLGVFSFITLVLPIMYIIYCLKKNCKYGLCTVFGILLFLFPQVIFRITLISKLQSQFVFLNEYLIDLVLVKGITSGMIEEGSKYVGIKIINKVSKINKYTISKFFLGYGFCELFIFGLTGFRLFINSVLIYFNVYPNLNLESNDALILISSINQSLFVPMFFSVIERICTLFFHYFTIKIIAYNIDSRRTVIISIVLHTLFNIIGIYCINEINPYFGRLVLILLTYIMYKYSLISTDNKLISEYEINY